MDCLTALLELKCGKLPQALNCVLGFPAQIEICSGRSLNPYFLKGFSPIDETR